MKTECRICGRSITLTYRISTSGRARVVRLADPSISRGIYCLACAEARKATLDEKDAAFRALRLKMAD